jgi:uncharacterized membrane protein YoaK (UPF0700 family)
MSSLDIAASPSLHREETVPVALLLAFAAGYLDAYTWIIHGVMANAQTANLIFLWVYGMAGNWQKALHFVPPILAFTIGIAIATGVRHVSGERASAISTLIEIMLLIAIGILHNRMPALAGTLGISFVAALQMAVFTRVEGVPYSSVMITGNLRQSIEAVLAAFYASGPPGPLRRAAVFASLCLVFGAGAAVGALATRDIPNLALGIPVIALLIVLLRCEVERHEVQA